MKSSVLLWVGTLDTIMYFMTKVTVVIMIQLHALWFMLLFSEFGKEQGEELVWKVSVA